MAAECRDDVGLSIVEYLTELASNRREVVEQGYTMTRKTPLTRRTFVRPSKLSAYWSTSCTADVCKLALAVCRSSVYSDSRRRSLHWEFATRTESIQNLNRSLWSHTCRELAFKTLFVGILGVNRGDYLATCAGDQAKWQNDTVRLKYQSPLLSIR